MEEKQNSSKNKLHMFHMKNRQECQITGVVDVKSYEPQEVIVVIEDSILSIKGEKLHVNRLNLESGELDLDGKVNAIHYAQHTSMAQKSENILARMFR